MSIASKIEALATARNIIRSKMMSVGQATKNDKLATLAQNLNIPNTSDATATANDIVLGKSAYVQGEKIIGELMPETDYMISSNGNFYSGYGGLYNMADFNSEVNIGKNIEVLDYAFYNCQSFNQPIVMSEKIKSCQYTFYNCIMFNQNIQFKEPNYSNIGWQTLSFNYFMRNCFNFNKPVDFSFLNNLNVGVFFSNTFYNCINFNENVILPNIDIMSMNYMFANDISFNKQINFPDVKYSGGLDGLLQGCTSYNMPFTFPNQSPQMIPNVFKGCTNFNQPITLPYHSLGCRIFGMFENCTNFNSPIDFSNKIQSILSNTFRNCIKFNQNVTYLFENLGDVLELDNCFNNCTNFNISFNHITGISKASNAFRNCINLKITDLYFSNAKMSNYSYMFFNCKNVYGNFYFQTTGSGSGVFSFYGMFGNTDRSKRKNIYLDGLGKSYFLNNLLIETICDPGVTISWTNTSDNNCFYNTTFNVYIYKNYTWNYTG